jgi:NTP pyrophosphatase (non-canonical NTP hydrolase)
MTLNQMAKQHYAWVESVGWHNKSVLEQLALIASEVGEAVNECRGDKPTEALGGELADIILRVIDLAYSEGVDIELEVWKKMEICRERGTRGRLK